MRSPKRTGTDPLGRCRLRVPAASPPGPSSGAISACFCAAGRQESLKLTKVLTAIVAAPALAGGTCACEGAAEAAGPSQMPIVERGFLLQPIVDSR
jgi:hypothetical protein